MKQRKGDRERVVRSVEVCRQEAVISELSEMSKMSELVMREVMIRGSRVIDKDSISNRQIGIDRTICIREVQYSVSSRVGIIGQGTQLDGQQVHNEMRRPDTGRRYVDRIVESYD